MSSAIIPATVNSTGPQYQVFPNEVLIEILKYLLILPASMKPIAQLYVIRHGRYNKLLQVSKNFAACAREAFYGMNAFVFPALSKLRLPPTWWNEVEFAPRLPPVVVRQYLRRIHITIPLRDYYWTANPNDDSGRIANRIVSLAQLYQHCDGARQLRDLTHAVTGFGRLEVLDLEIYEDFRFGFDVDTSLAIYRSAGFTVRAGQVNVSVWVPWQQKYPEAREELSRHWYPRLVEVITVQ
jgi:hypothetical protein